MNSPAINTIVNYLNSQSRNKIILHLVKIPSLDYVNIGLQLAERLYKFNKTDKASLMVLAELEIILQGGIKQHPVFGRYLALENLGILLEPELKIDFPRFLENYSQNNPLFVLWEGEIEEGRLFFLTKANGVKVDIKNVSHISI